MQVSLRLGTGLPPGGLAKAGKARLQKQRNKHLQPQHIAHASINRVGEISDHKWAKGSRPHTPIQFFGSLALIYIIDQFLELSFQIFKISAHD